MSATNGGGAGRERQVVLVGGRRLPLTSLDKVMYPETGFTKADVLAYYQAVAPALLPLAAGRPATRKRWVNGVGTPAEPGQVFFVKNLEQGAPDWVRSVELEHKAHRIRYPLIDDLATLMWAAQMGALELHVPQWRVAVSPGGGLGERRNPDRLVLDLDPGEGVGLPEAAEVARLARRILAGMGLDPLPVTSGSKGIHLYAPLDGTRTSDEVSAVAHELARALEADHPDLVVSDMKKERRRGKVLVDWSQNNAAKTTIVPYSLRGTVRPMAAAPRTWRELASAALRQLEPHEVVERLQRRGGLIAPLTPDEPRSDALAQYRSMRDAGKTPEPGVLAAGTGAPRSGAAAVPVGRVLAAWAHGASRAGETGAPRSGAAAVPVGIPGAVSEGRGDSFVLQEHHARRLHWDLRLERDGVLVSWALPRGVPAPGERNHLAVHTEDHPLEYGAFEGEIPSGEYGGGSVSIWDTGTFTPEKWRDDEVIAVLHGRRGGGLGGEPARIALIRTGRGRSVEGQGPYGEQWLIHRMALEAPGARAAAPEPAARVQPEAMLAAVAADAGLDPHTAWALEMKWDGIRALAVLDNGALRLVSRNDLDLTPTYPELGVLPGVVDARSAVLDGEIVAVDERGRPSFSRLQQRSGLTRPGDVERARRTVAVRYLLFDVLEVDGRSLLETPYHERRAVLERLVRERDGVDVPPVVAEATGDELADALAAALATSEQLGLEGVVAKRVDSPYAAGRRSTDWLKLKHERAQEVVVGGWRPGNGRRAGGVGSLLLGIPTDDGLEYVGRVGTGFSDRELAEAERRLRELASTTSPFREVPRPDARDAHWVTPSLVGEVRFAEWTHGGHLRQPSWRGWRPDKRPAEVVRES